MNMSSLMSASMTTSVAMTLVFVIGMYIVYRDLKRLEAAVDKMQFQMSQSVGPAVTIYDSIDHDSEFTGREDDDDDDDKEDDDDEEDEEDDKEDIDEEDIDEEEEDTDDEVEVNVKEQPVLVSQSE